MKSNIFGVLSVKMIFSLFGVRASFIKLAARAVNGCQIMHKNYYYYGQTRRVEKALGRRSG